MKAAIFCRLSALPAAFFTRPSTSPEKLVSPIFTTLERDLGGLKLHSLYNASMASLKDGTGVVAAAADAADAARVGAGVAAGVAERMEVDGAKEKELVAALAVPDAKVGAAEGGCTGALKLRLPTPLLLELVEVLLLLLLLLLLPPVGPCRALKAAIFCKLSALPAAFFTRPSTSPEKLVLPISTTLRRDLGGSKLHSLYSASIASLKDGTGVEVGADAAWLSAGVAESAAKEKEPAAALAVVKDAGVGATEKAKAAGVGAAALTAG